MRDDLLNEEFDAFLMENYGTTEPTDQMLLETDRWLDEIIDANKGDHNE